MTLTTFLLYAGGGLFIGMTSGLLGIGGGALLVPLLVFGFKMNIHDAIGTSLVLIIPTALFGGAVHYLNGHVSLKMVLSLCAFTVIGGIIGAQLAGYVPSAVLKKVFSVFLVLIAVKMFLS